jgi:hypothetical protein
VTRHVQLVGLDSSYKIEKEMESRSVGRAHVGGPFEMTTHDGKPFTHGEGPARKMEPDLLRLHQLPKHICPDKMSAAVTEFRALPFHAPLAALNVA